jgi:hypothetical protein
MIDLSAFIKITLPTPDDFNKVKETLTRIGVASQTDKALYQSCHILHKRGEYYICHFKELFALDGKPSSLTDSDIARRNTIAKLLEEWGLLSIVNGEIIQNTAPLHHIKILSFKEKPDWKLVAKYTIGKKIPN